MLESFTRDGEPERWPNPEKEMRRKKFGDSVDLEQKRFLLPTNPEAKALLDKLREAVNFLKENHQEVIGFSLHGSLVKGYATEKSDIDGYLLIDSDKAERPIDAEDKEKYPFGWEVVLPGLLENELKQIISMPEKTKDIVALNFNNETLEKDYEMRDFSRLYIPFLPTIGLGGREYREFILNKLENMGKSGEALWETITNKLWEDENIDFGKEIADKRYELYPKSIKEARNYFVGNGM